MVDYLKEGIAFIETTVNESDVKFTPVEKELFGVILGALRFTESRMRNSEIALKEIEKGAK